MDITQIIWLSYFFNFIIIVTLVCFQKRSPIASIAWIMCLLFFPIVGAIIFLTFGVGIRAYTRHKYHVKLELNEAHILEQQKLYMKSIDVSVLPYSTLISYFLNSSFVYTENNSAEIFTDAKTKYDELFKDIEAAKESINISYFIIRNDTVGNKLVALLTKKAQEGVKVRLMYDGFGSILTPRRLFDPLRRVSGSEVAEFFPVRLFSFSKINHRNHRKIVVIDDSTAYIGGMNIGDEYMQCGKRESLNWRDTHLKIRGEAVKYIQSCFAMDWEFSTGKSIEINTHNPVEITENRVPMQIVASGPDSNNEEIKSGMLRMIYSAKKYVYIQTPYFVPDQAFLTALQIAAQSGVDVQLMIPGIPDKKYVYHSTMSYIGELLEYGVKVHLYPGFIHSKTVTIDDKILTIGTTNTDIRSFQLLFEINAFMYSDIKAIEHREIFEKDAAQCSELTSEEYKNRGIFRMFKEGFFRLFSPIM